MKIRLPVAKEGLLYSIIPILLGVIFLFFRFWALGVILITVSLFMFFFFRYPLRDIEWSYGLVYAPCDGRIIDIREMDEDGFIDGGVNRVSIFMSLFNVHINYAPINGVVEVIKYLPGGFKRADIVHLGDSNESNFIGMSNGHMKVGIRQVAGWVARRIVCDCKLGDNVLCGSRIGMIKFGSRVDVYFPKNYNVCVKIGQIVRAGRTVLGEEGGFIT